MKKYLMLLSVSILFCSLLCSCGNSQKQSDKQDKFSPVGVYRADLTLMQSGKMTTIVIKSDGSATMQQEGDDVDYYSWVKRYDGDAIEIEVTDYQGFTIGTYVMDFSSGYIYFGRDKYESKNPNQRYKFTKSR